MLKHNNILSKRKRFGLSILTVLIVVVVVVLFFSPPITQDLLYHNFSNGNMIFDIPNFWNVVTNLPFLIVGLFGLINLNILSKPRFQYIIFFIGLIFIAFGSSYYHMNPNNETLIWDRLSMIVAIMSLISIVISEFINNQFGKKSLIPLLTIGFFSILYWVIFDDLRIYVAVQFLPLIALPLILILFKSKYNILKSRFS